MPEGPEVRTICTVLSPIISGTILNKIEWSQKSKRHKLIDDYHKLPLPCTIQGITCRGKKIFFILETSLGLAFITSTLGMSGRWCWDKANNSHLWLELGDKKLWYDDARHFGNLELWLDYEAMMKKVRKEIGPDLLAYALERRLADKEEEITKARWREVIKNQRIARQQVCQFLMDQKRFSGIGNYLKAEVLYRSGLAPDRTLASLALEEVDRLRTVCLETICASFLAGGLTVSTYWDPDGTKGQFQVYVYGKTYDPEGNPVIRETFKDGRTTYWCPKKQH